MNNNDQKQLGHHGNHNRRAKSFLHPKICKNWKVVKKMLSYYDFVAIRRP